MIDLDEQTPMQFVTSLRDQARQAVIDDLAGLVAYHQARQLLAGDLAESLNEQRAKIDQKRKAAEQAEARSKAAERNTRELQAARLLSEDKTEQARLADDIAGAELLASNARSEALAANNRLLDAEKDLRTLEALAGRLQAIEQPAAGSLRAALALLEARATKPK